VDGVPAVHGSQLVPLNVSAPPSVRFPTGALVPVPPQVVAPMLMAAVVPLTVPVVLAAAPVPVCTVPVMLVPLWVRTNLIVVLFAWAPPQPPGSAALVVIPPDQVPSKVVGAAAVVVVGLSFFLLQAMPPAMSPIAPANNNALPNVVRFIRFSLLVDLLPSAPS
jgi:hypothetical protein